MYKTVMTFELEQIMKKEKVNIIDCREEDEYSEGHMPGAINMPLSAFLDYLHLIDKSKAYYVVCYSGSRSQTAAQYLGNQGYKVTNVMGGMSIYRGPIET